MLSLPAFWRLLFWWGTDRRACFADVELTGWIEEAGLEAGPSRTLPPSTAADGPGLFTMIAKKPNPGGEIR